MTVDIIKTFMENVEHRMTGNDIIDNEIAFQAYKLLALLLEVK